MPLNELFIIEYGNQYDLNKLYQDNDGINFVSRSSSNLGITAKVERTQADPYDKGLITVALGGSVLSSFVQPEEFYTAQNIKVLRPKQELAFNEKVFYCVCILKNGFKYSAFGREANTSLDFLLVPNIKHIPHYLKEHSFSDYIFSKSIIAEELNFDATSWRWFQYKDLFHIERGRGARVSDISESGKTPFVTSINSNNGTKGFVDFQPEHDGNVITVNRNGSIGEAFYQEKPFCSTEDVHVFVPKFELDKYIAMFLIALIRKESFRYSYGRKWGLSRMRNSWIKLPIDQNNKVDWNFIRYYIKSLNYSSGI